MPLVFVLAKSFRDDALQFVRHARVGERERRGFSVDNIRERFRHRRALKGCHTREQLIGDDAEAEYIGTLVDGLGFGLLG
jgi:hypothetical protein